VGRLATSGGANCHKNCHKTHSWASGGGEENRHKSLTCGELRSCRAGLLHRLTRSVSSQKRGPTPTSGISRTPLPLLGQRTGGPRRTAKVRTCLYGATCPRCVPPVGGLDRPYCQYIACPDAKGSPVDKRTARIPRRVRRGALLRSPTARGESRAIYAAMQEVMAPAEHTERPARAKAGTQCKCRRLWGRRRGEWFSS
jgi:hypothetical protein